MVALASEFSDRSSWEAVAESFVRSSDLESPTTGPRHEKLYCEKSYELLVAWEKILRVTRGHGLAYFIDKRFKGQDLTITPARWPPVAEPEPLV